MFNKQPGKFRGEKNAIVALPGVAQRTNPWPANQEVAGSIPSQGTCLDCRPGPPLVVCEAKWLMFLSHIDVSLPPFPFLKK